MTISIFIHSALNYSNLINSTGYQTLYVFPLPEDLGKSRAEGWSSLNSRKAHLSNIVTVLESKDTPSLVHCHTLLHTKNLTVETWLRTVGRKKQEMRIRRTNLKIISLVLSFASATANFHNRLLCHYCCCCCSDLKYSMSEKIKVLLTSKPQAMISLAFSCASRLDSSTVISFQRNFSSSVIWTTSGTSNTSCRYL